MDASQMSGLCYLIAVCLFGIWWRLRIEAEWREDKQDEDDE